MQEHHFEVTGCQGLSYSRDSSLMSAFACRVALEEGISEETSMGMKKRGHTVISGVTEHARAMFGRGQIVQRNPKTGVLWGGSEPRADGQVLGW